MKDKYKVAMMIVVAAAVITTLGVYLLAADFDFGSKGVSFIVIVIALIATYMAITRAKSIRRGLPAGDELSKRVMHKAGYYTFLCIIYVALGIPWISEMFEIEIIGRHVSAIIILCSAILFFIFYFWFNRKGDI